MMPYCIEDKEEIKKATLYFVTKFLCTIVHFRLIPTTSDNILTWKRAALVASLVAGYEIDFTTLIRMKVYDRELAETNALPFLCIIQ